MFVTLEKERYPRKQDVRTVLASKHPDLDVTSILDGGDRWITRLAAGGPPSKLEDSLDDADLPPLPGEGDSEDAPKDEPKDDAEDAPEDDAADDDEDDAFGRLVDKWPDTRVLFFVRQSGRCQWRIEGKASIDRRIRHCRRKQQCE